MLPHFFAKNFKEERFPKGNIPIYIMLKDLFEILILYLINFIFFYEQGVDFFFIKQTLGAICKR